MSNINWKKLLTHGYLYLLLIVIYAPILIIIIYSFTESKVLGNWTGFSFGLYENLFSGTADGASALYNALENTIIIALTAAIVSTMMGTVAAIGIHNMRGVQKRTVSFLNNVPMINPDIITGISIFLLFVFLGISRGMFTVICSHIAFCTPYVILSVMPRLTKMNPNIYEAALDLGATPWQAFRKILMPELWPGMVSGFILSLTLSIDDFAVTFFTKGSDGLETLSTYIYSDARKGGLTPELRPLSALIFIAILLLLIIVNVRANKQKKELHRKKVRH
ncbi:MAG: ABC transporter permease [Prevotella sp.]|nr:ABC transporter permease [Prevotella sp.]